MDENQWVAAQLREMAELLEAQGANPFRADAYRRAADMVGRWEEPLREILDARGRPGLQEIPGIGTGISAAIAEMLITGAWGQLRRLRGETEPRAHHEAVPAGGELPDVATLLDVDREYRQKALAGTLRLIAPKRFNPDGKAWLPVLHTKRGRWHFTALFSNTARAHELGTTHDWVVIYFYDDEHREGQCTVITATRGEHAGARVVRGHEPARLRTAA